MGFALAGFLLAGFSETVSLLLTVVFSALWLRSRNRRYGCVACGLLVGLVVVFLAPGNAVRAASLPERLNPLFALSLATRETLLFILTQQPIAVALAFLVGYCCPSSIYIQRRALTGILVLVVALGSMILNLAIPLIGTNAFAPRHFTVNAFILSVTLFSLGVLCAGFSRSSSSL